MTNKLCYIIDKKVVLLSMNEVILLFMHKLTVTVYNIILSYTLSNKHL